MHKINKYENKMDTKKTDNKKEIVDSHNQKVINCKKLFLSEMVLCFASIIMYIIAMFMCAYAIEELNIVAVPVIIIVVSTILFFVICFMCLYFEYAIGVCHICGKCQHKYVPTFNQLCWAPHIGWTRYMRCPKCGKLSWQKKSFE